jgi:hypothetical protein
MAASLKHAEWLQLPLAGVFFRKGRAGADGGQPVDRIFDLMRGFPVLQQPGNRFFLVLLEVLIAAERGVALHPPPA